MLSQARLCHCKTKTHFIAILLGEMLFCVKHHSVVSGEDDDDLYASLARARKAAEKPQKGSSVQDPFAEQLASRRDQDEAEQATDTDKPAGMLISWGLLVGCYLNRVLRGGPVYTCCEMSWYLAYDLVSPMMHMACPLVQGRQWASNVGRSQ